MIIKGGSGAVGSNYIGQTYIAGSPTPLQYSEAYEDTVSATDTGISKAIKSWAEAVGLTDSGSVVQVFLKHFIETVALLEDFAYDLDKFYSRLFTETIHIGEVYDRALDKLMSFSDALGLSEVFSKVLPSIEWTESVLMADSFTRAIEIVKSEIISLTESFVATLGKIFTDTLNITDTIGTLKALVKEYVDTLAITDTATKAISVVGTTLVSIADSIKRRLNGMLILWEKLKSDVIGWSIGLAIASEDEEEMLDESGTIMAMEGLDRQTPEEYSTINKLTTDVWTQEGKNDGTYTSVSKASDDWTKLKDENE